MKKKKVNKKRTPVSIVMALLFCVAIIYFAISFFNTNKEINEKKDEIIRKGYQIGNVGSTGAVTGPHLHFEIRVNGAAQDPRRLLPAIWGLNEKEYIIF